MATNAFSRRTVRSILLSALLLGIPSAGYGFAEIYRGALTLDLDGRVIYDSNIGGNALEVSDTLFSLRPRLNYKRDIGRTDISAWFGLNFSRYQDYTEIDFDDFDTGFTVTAPTAQGSKFNGNLDFRYYQNTGSNQGTLSYLQMRTFNFAVNGSYLVGSKTSLRFGAGYRTQDPQPIFEESPRTYSESTYYDFSIGVGYELRSINTVFLDYRRSYNTSENPDSLQTNRDYVSDAIFLGISRPLGGKLSGSASFGYQTTKDNLDTDLETDRFLVSANVTWLPRATTNVGLQISRNLNISGLNTGYYQTAVGVTARQDLGQRFNLNGRLRYSWFDYESDRSDTLLDFMVGLGYSYNTALTGGIDYEYNDSSSNRELGDYTRNRVTLYVSYEF